MGCVKAIQNHSQPNDEIRSHCVDLLLVITFSRRVSMQSNDSAFLGKIFSFAVRNKPNPSITKDV